ncbi:SymE family type I addiction module toxin [Xanthomonas campestris]|uniref:SymE family type I addiction module toxin n=2 Tax=Xanthomonas TaxID=338 RepID=UPI000E329BE8|nr:SymE family type I addiction module toxin [Xanthomonas campestris]MCC5088755.1 type I toxin-antitoxin system SymE family toxin [Xanthomonas campestris]MEA9491094.1 SymE family type I addiction module toxin [Xanthomonas campestris]MEA9509552.1 SymE family type I addiction module toxin [Xanthomonas campestris]MEA9577235.1 SymE family type I addiction module toxin [Xanthomonas campestris]MEB2112240.1 SymE family type I addiction module toxin [Xanthomonas campestris pv. campestris]
MRQPPSRTTTTRKRAKRQPTRDAVWRIVETPLTPMLTPEQIAAANAADLAKQQRAPRRPRPPQQLTVGYGYYTASSQRIPTLRLRGRWLEQLGFAIGSKLNIRMRDGELVVSVADKD